MAEEIKEIECVITGRVQLVMYRDFACRKARGLGVNGTVENLLDGSVRVIAQGTEERLALFLEKLKKGPLLARVEHVNVIWRHPTQKFRNFSMIR